MSSLASTATTVVWRFEAVRASPWARCERFARTHRGRRLEGACLCRGWDRRIRFCVVWGEPEDGVERL